MPLIGPFSQIVTFRNLCPVGPVGDDMLEIISSGGVVVDGCCVKAVGEYSKLSVAYSGERITPPNPSVLIPGFVDCHTHICFSGKRIRDYALRVAGASYLDIANAGGGIMDTVRHTREATQENLEKGIEERCWRLYKNGVTTCEVKGGYGLNFKDELKMLRAIAKVTTRGPIDLIPTFLGAHVKPPEFVTHQEYLEFLQRELFPVILAEKLSERVDIFVDEGAFCVKDALTYLEQAQKSGFKLVVHADQFTVGGSLVAAKTAAVSADHLEVTSETEVKELAKAGVCAVVLPGASLGLGVHFAPARKLLDAGCCVAISSDWNPGSAPQGDLLTQAALISANQKLTIAETLAGITVRAAKALGLSDRGTIDVGQRADFTIFPTDDYREILYWQGGLRPDSVYKNGKNLIY